MSQPMQIQQAIFTSSDRGTMKGYQLVAKSAGVDRACAQELCRWSPSQMTSDDPSRWTINYFPVLDDHVAVTRTVLGGPEYSARGGIQVVTLILVLTNDQFANYGCNAVSVARTAMLYGWLRLPLDVGRQALETIQLPHKPLVEPVVVPDHEDALLQSVMSMVRESRRVAIIGDHDPLGTIETLIAWLPVESRRAFSFTTGLAPAVRRPFQTHFLDNVSNSTQRTLDSQSIACVAAC